MSLSKDFHALELEGVESIDLREYSRAILNILEDFSGEKDRLNDTQRAILNVLEDFAAEKRRLEETQRAVLNILDDFDEQKRKVEAANRELRREILERSQAQAALLEQGTQLARSNAELEQFAYVASHDLQEPLRMVSSYVQLFEQRYKGLVDERADKYIHYAVEGAKRMQALIGGLLEYSRVGRVDGSEHVVMDAQAAHDEAVANINSAIEESGARVTSEPLPRVVGDMGQITQIFQNLLGNAIKFRRAGVAPRVCTTASMRGAFVEFAVTDNGIGMDPQFADRVFVIFQRLHTRTEYPGTGIGLSICKKVVERHGGTIWFESAPDEGATFRFTLPAVKEAA